MGVKLVLGLLGIVALILALLLAGLKIMTTVSDPDWQNVAIGLGVLIIDFIIAFVVVNYLRSKMSTP